MFLCDYFSFSVALNAKYKLSISVLGTAAVAVAGIIASLRITGKSLLDNVFVFQGAGEVSVTL